MKTIGIIGSGTVAQTLAKGFLEIGYQVKVGTRDTSKLNDIEGIEKGSVSDAIAYSNLLLLCVKGTVAVDVLSGFDLSGKTIIDTTNPIADLAPRNGVLQYFTDMNKSLCEILQEIHPGANFVKAFNSVGAHLMVKPNFNGTKPTMFICGNNSESKSVVVDILDKFGWETEDLGAVEAAVAIEVLCMLWCIPGINKNQWVHAFKLLK